MSKAKISELQIWISMIEENRTEQLETVSAALNEEKGKKLRFNLKLEFNSISAMDSNANLTY